MIFKEEGGRCYADVPLVLRPPYVFFILGCLLILPGAVLDARSRAPHSGLAFEEEGKINVRSICALFAFPRLLFMVLGVIR